MSYAIRIQLVAGVMEHIFYAFLIPPTGYLKYVNGKESSKSDYFILIFAVYLPMK
jgi:hypothetical protein